ncbi:MAG: DUF362 domain-containing protein [Candidatus Eisenbacteria bacterium]|nr:DUF362 domain-containing protein [Candidatus Eisenbacteria bacterium]
MSSRPTVYLRRVPLGEPASWPHAVESLLDASGLLADLVEPEAEVAIKVHVGEPGVATALPAVVAGAAAGKVRALGGRPFFTDTAVLYGGPRSTGVGHAEVAAKHGFTLEDAGAIFVPADGMLGNLEIEVAVDGRHYASVGVAEAVAEANAMLVVSHATGHLLSGFGATLKNIGMGCSSKKGKLLQHSETKPFVKQDLCGSCGLCVVHCPTGALSLNGGPARIDESLCSGCGECLAQCRSGAIGFRWDIGPATMQEKMVEHALGTIRSLDGKLLYLTGIVNVTQHCDCLPSGSPVIASDVGFALSSDPVALDQATVDLVEEVAGTRLDRLAFPHLDGSVQLAYAEQLGLGSREYELSVL